MGATNNYQTLTRKGNLTKPYAHYRKFAVSVGVFFLSFFIAGTFSPVLPSSALTCTDGSISDPGSTSATIGDPCGVSGTSVTVNIENPAYLTITSSAAGLGGISLDYTKEGSPNLGSLITASDTVTTTSNTGQTKYLYISTSFNSSTTESNRLTNSNTDLSNDKTFIPAGGGDTLDNTASLSDNTWGFSLTDPSSIAGSNTEIFTKVPTIGNELLVQEGTGEFDDDTNDYVSTQNIYYSAIATSDLYAGEYSNTIKYTAFTDEPVVLTHYMQDFTIQDCNNLKTSTATEDHRITLIDKRDNKPYKVSRLADGNCWMVQNLALDGTDEKTGEARVLRPNDSNVTQDRALTKNITSGTAMGNTAAQIFSGVATDYTSSCSYTYCITSIEPYGNHYNWIAATAGVGTKSSDATVYESICPSASGGSTWRLPDNGTTDGLKSYSNLAAAYNFPTGNITDAAAVLAIQQAPLFFPLSGWYNNSSATYQGRGTRYWSRTTVLESAATAYNLAFSAENRGFHSQHTNNKSYGATIRCVFGE